MCNWPLTTRRRGLDRREGLTTALAVIVSTGLYLRDGHDYLAPGVLGDLAGLISLTVVAIRWRRRLRHEALVCLGCIGVVLTLDPGWPVRLPGSLWWSLLVVALGVYLGARTRLLR